MTLRQILDVLWKRKWVVVVVTVAAVITAIVYLALRTETYETQGSVRLNPVVTEAAITGELGGITVDFSEDIVLSPTVLEPAALSLGETTLALAEDVDAELVEGARSGQMEITAVALDPASAQARTNAVIDAYRAYVDEQVILATTALNERLQEAVNEATQLQGQVADDSTNSIAATNLATALSRMTSISSQIESISSAGSATTVLTAVPAGELTVPGIPIVLLLALATGLIVGIGAALIRDQFDDRLRGEDEIEGLVGVPGLGELSWDRSLARLQPPLPLANNDRTDLSEGIRTLRSTLQVFLPPREGVVVVTSVEPGDGKSFVSANLALAWARAGRTVILVGGDLRRPDLGRYFGDAADGEGLAEILQRDDAMDPLEADFIESRINSTRYRRLRVLPAGAEPPDPADLLARPRFVELISILRARADIVIVDSPPAMGMTDAALLASNADGAIIIASIRRTDRGRLVDTASTLRAAGVNLLGVVANRSRRKLPKSYSAYYLGSRSRATPRQPARAVADSTSGTVSAASHTALVEQELSTPKAGRPSPKRARRGSRADSDESLPRRTSSGIAAAEGAEVTNVSSDFDSTEDVDSVLIPDSTEDLDSVTDASAEDWDGVDLGDEWDDELEDDFDDTGSGSQEERPAQERR